MGAHRKVQEETNPRMVPCGAKAISILPEDKFIESVGGMRSLEDENSALNPAKSLILNAQFLVLRAEHTTFRTE